MSLPALSSFFVGCYAFVPSVTTMLQGTVVTQHLSISSFQFLSRLPLFLISFSGFPSLLRFPPLSLSRSFSLFCSGSHAFPWYLWFCDYIWFGGRQRGCSSEQRDALRGFSLWKPSNLNADGNIFRWFNSTMCNIQNRALFFYTGSLVTLIYFFYKLVHLNGPEKKTNAKIPEQICFKLIKAL